MRGPTVLQVLTRTSKELAEAMEAHSAAQVQCQQTLDALIESYLNEGVFPSIPVYAKLAEYYKGVNVKP